MKRRKFHNNDKSREDLKNRANFNETFLKLLNKPHYYGKRITW